MQPKASTVPTCLLLITLALLAAPAAGDDTYWQVGTDTWFSDPNWTMGIPQVGDTVYINNAGTAQIASGSGETTYLYLGDAGGESGTVELSGTSQLSAEWEYVGYSGTGTFAQSGGTNTVTGNLSLGYGATGDGTYTISAGTLDVSGGLIRVGGWGTGAFNLNGGVVIADEVAKGASGTFSSIVGGMLRVNTLTGFGATPSFGGSLEIGHAGGSATGSYSVGVGESLSLGDSLTVGYDSGGTFTQTGGTNTVTNRTYLGYNSTGQGTYELSGTGELSAYVEQVGYEGTGTLTQTGGTNAVGSYLNVGAEAGSDGTYELSGTGVLQARYEHVGNGGTGTFTQSGGTNTVTDSLWVGTNPSGVGTYTISAGTLDVSGGLIEVGDLGTGEFNLNGGLVIADQVAKGASGTFTSTAGGTLRVNTLTGFGTAPSFAGSLQIGHAGGSATGSYSVGAGESLSVVDSLTVGYDSTGTFTQTGGTNTVTEHMDIGVSPTGQGTYELSGTGQLSAGWETVGDSGTGTFTQTGGTNTVTGSVMLGWGLIGEGTYALSGTGCLSADEENVGYHGTGTFTQTGGTNTVTNDLYLGSEATGDGTYELSGGTLTVGGQIEVGYAGTGRFECNGGTVSAGGMALGSQGTLAMGYDFNVADLGAGHLPGTAVPLSGLDVGTLEVTKAATATQGASLTLGALVVKPGSLYLLDEGVLTVPSVLNEGEVLLGSLTCRVSGGTVTNQGVLRGTGRIVSVLTNEATGEVRVASGERLVLTGAGNTNAGKMEAIGGEIEFTQDLTNAASTGLVAGSDATLRFTGGLTNNGSVALSFGRDFLSGDINNAAAGTIIVSGNAGATFYDDVTNAGTIQVSAGSTAVFFGAFRGTGTTGAGDVFLEGDTRPGMSAGVMGFGGDVFLGPAARLEAELGGTAAGSGYDQVNVAGNATLDGTLAVSLIDSFEPAPGDAFTVLTYGSRSGEFVAVTGWEHDELAHLAVYGPNALTLHCTYFGDATLDGCVDGADYTLWADHYKQAGDWGDGDFTGDGCVNGADYTLWADNYTGSCGQVPEPATLALLALGGLALIRRPRRLGACPFPGKHLRHIGPRENP